MLFDPMGENMKVLHILIGGDVGGIETLCKDYVRKSKNQNIVLFLNGGGILQEELQNEGIETIDFMGKSKNIVSTLRRVKQTVEKNQIDAIVVHHSAPISHLCAIFVKRRMPNVKTLVYAHGCAEDMCREKDKKGLALRKWIIAKSLNDADSVVAISKSVKKSLKSYLKISNKTINIIYNGVDLERFFYKPQKKRDGLTQLIYVGRLIPEKGVDQIIRSISLIKNDNVKLSIVGVGSEMELLKELSHNLGLDNKIHFLGQRRDVPELLNKADAFVHMPKWEEGFGITIIEAMACGLICVCGERGAIPEIINNKVNGYIIDADSEKQLADIIEFITQNKNGEVLKRIKHNAIERANDFSIDNYVEQLDRVVETS